MTPPAPKRRRGRPRRQAVVIVNVRLPEVVYDAYCIRSHKSTIPVRTLLKRTIIAGVRRDDLGPKEARALALALLMSAEDIERNGVDRRAPE